MTQNRVRPGLPALRLTLGVLVLTAGTVAQDHWAYVKPTRPAPPNVDDAAWSRRAIDRFVLARMQRHGLGHASTASRPTLLRRVFLDLIGLPPSLAQVNAFVADDSKDACTSVVDRRVQNP